MPWRGKARAREIEGDGKLADRLGEKERVKERVAALVAHRRAGQNEVTERRVKRGKETGQMRRG